ncbi:MAG: hypothetical protein GXO79_09570 [Chlorobi bacterium]|nr:hypothetical protein [Chlorobiota bacterium]
MKIRILNLSIAIIATAVVILGIEFFLFGLNSKPKVVLSVNSPNTIFEAYVTENPSLDPPNQSMFIAERGTNKFKLVENLPEDIESVQKTIWSPDSKIVVFVTNWNLIITNVEHFNTMKICLNNDWWKRHDNKKTFSSSGKKINLKKLEFINSDTLVYMTNEMLQPVKIGLVYL